MTDSARKTDAKAPTSYDCSDGLLPGGIIRVRFYCLFWHKGVYMGGNDVIHNAKKTGVSRTSLNGFSCKKNICKDNAATGDDRAAVCRRARAALAKGRKYNFFTDNCEHFANEMSGRGKKCEQFREIGVHSAKSAACGALSAGAAAIFSETPPKQALKFVAIGAAIGAACALIFYVVEQNQIAQPAENLTPVSA